MTEPLIESFFIHDIDHGTGGRIAIARLPGRSGHLEEDVEAIAGLEPALVLSLTEREEATIYGAGALGALLEPRGIRHLWFPIRDFGAPEADDAHWRMLAAELHGSLDRGEAILLHCLGGKGRSGMIAMRLMVERGLSPDDALRRVRLARPGAVETGEQEAWAARTAG